MGCGPTPCTLSCRSASGSSCLPLLLYGPVRLTLMLPIGDSAESDIAMVALSIGWSKADCTTAASLPPHPSATSIADTTASTAVIVLEVLRGIQPLPCLHPF